MKIEIYEEQTMPTDLSKIDFSQAAAQGQEMSADQITTFQNKASEIGIRLG